MKKLNSFQLKIIALIVMLMDHLYFAFNTVFPLWFHPLSRFVAPLFGYFLVEGLFHTSNRLKYNFRLFGWAIFMELGNFALNKILSPKGIIVSNNIFLTLALGLTIINLLEYSKDSQIKLKWGLRILAIVLIPLGLITEGGIALIPFILITYFFRGNMKKTIIGYAILFILLFIMSFQQMDTLEMTINMLMFNSDFLLILVVPFILLYNGERGPSNKFNKYLFYVFYPLHLWLLAIIEYVIS